MGHTWGFSTVWLSCNAPYGDGLRGLENIKLFYVTEWDNREHFVPLPFTLTIYSAPLFTDWLEVMMGKRMRVMLRLWMIGDGWSGRIAEPRTEH